MTIRSLLLIMPFLLVKCYAQNNTDPAAKYEIEFYCAPCGCIDDNKIFRNGGSCPSCSMVLQTRVKGLEGKPVRPFVRRTAAILLFDMADIMDVTGPMSVMEHAGFNVITVAKNKNPKSIGMYNHFTPDYSFEDMPQVDVIILPGGGPAESNQDPEIINWVKKQFDQTETLFSVCSGAFFLAEAGLLDDQQATTFASLIPRLKNDYPKVIVRDDVKYTVNKRIITSSGLSSGIDASFEVVAKYYGYGTAQDIANHMEYPWMKQNDYARTQLADNFIVGIGSIVQRFAVRYLKSEGNKDEWNYEYILWKEVNIADFLDLILETMINQSIIQNAEKKDKYLAGIISHPILGKGQVRLTITESDEGFRLNLNAKRLTSNSIKYTPLSQEQ